MSALNKLFPAILLAYVADVPCTLTAEECNELSKFVARLELEIERLTVHDEWATDVASRVKDALEKANERIAELQAEIAALKEAARRIPVSEQLPPRNVRVRVWINGTESIARYSWVVPQWETIDGLYYHGSSFDWVTDWQPLDEDGEG